MKDRNERLKAIREIIQKEHIHSQDVLLEKLSSDGFALTQATLSRDLKTLKVGKISDGSAGYYYSLPAQAPTREQVEQYERDFSRGFLSIDFSHNVGVIRTIGGHANSVALALDSLDFSEILGTVAGDDTIIVILKENVSGTEFLKELKARIKYLEV